MAFCQEERVCRGQLDLAYVMLGAFAGFLEFPDTEWKKVIEASVPKKTVEVNVAGFELGRKAARGA